MAVDTNVGNAAVLAKTGKEWNAWFRILDHWGAAEKGHKETARHLLEKHGLSAWWSQMVTVEYERARGLRKVNERPRGFAFSVSRTIAAPARRGFEAFTRANELSRRFTHGATVDARVGGRYRSRDGDAGEFLALDPPRLVRFTWENPDHAPGTVVEVRIEAIPRSIVNVRRRSSRSRAAIPPRRSDSPRARACDSSSPR